MRNNDYRWDESEKEAIIKVLESNNFTMGREVAEFEDDLATYFGRKYAVMVNSGSSANLVAVASLIYDQDINLKPGDEVIVPTLSWSTTYSPLIQYGLKLVFVDIDDKSLNIDLSKIEAAITEKTKLIMAVNILGNPIDYNRLENLCQKNSLYLMVDNCEGLGAKYRGQPVEKRGIISTISTFYSHQISTMEGGVAFTDNFNLYNIMKSIRAHGWTRGTNFKQNNDKFYDLFTFIYPGYNLRPLEFEAAIGKCQLRKLEKFIKIRRKNAYVYRELFENHKYIKIQIEQDESSWFGFPFVLKENAPYSRNEVVKKIVKSGIEVRPIISGNILIHPASKYYKYRVANDDKVAMEIHNNGFMIYNDIIEMSERFACIKTILDCEDHK